VAAFLFAGISGCAAGRSFSTGEQLEAEGKYEEAMLSYAEAYRVAPDVPEYRLRFLNARDRAADSRYAKGMRELSSNDYSAALIDFQVATGLDPSKEIYKQLIESTARKKDALQSFREGMEFEKDNKPKYANLSYDRAIELDPENSDYRAARDRVRALLDNRPSGYELNLKSLKPFAFKFTGSGLKDVFRILSQLSGINFIFDEGVKDQPVTINLERTNFKQVLDLLSTMNKLGSSILNEKTVLIYPKTADKIKQYEEMQMHTFHLNYMDAKKGINLIRTMLPARKIYVNEESNSIVVRDTSDTVKVIEKLLDANDLPDAEVMLDVEVMELNDKNTRNVGLVLSRYAVDIAGFDLNSGLQLADRLSQATSGDTTNAGVDNLVNVFTWNGFGGFVTVPSATYNFGKTIAKGEILANPKIRVKNKEKAKFTVGTRVPITTTTTNGTVGGYSVNVQYVDVGVKLNAEPVIQLNNAVDIKLSMEVSSIVGQETLADGVTTVVTIGTRNLETVLSLKDGETSVIGGLISRTNVDAKQKIFLLGDIPVIGPFISGNNNSKEKTEIVLAITPRLVRGLIAPKGNVTSFMSGKEDDPSLDTFPPATDEEPGIGMEPKQQGQASIQQSPPSPVAPRPAAGLQPPPLPAPAGQQQGAEPPVAAQPLPVAGVQPPTASPGSGQAVAPQPVPPASPAPDAVEQGAVPPPEASMKGGQIIISTPMTSKVGEPFTLEIQAVNVEAIRAASYVLTFDSTLLVPVSVSEGNFMKKPGMKTNFSRTVDAPGGTVSISLSLPSGSSGVGGSGVLSTAVFRPKKPGTAAFGFRDVAFISANGSQVSIMPFATSIGIQ
jgi:general secretion pathway protein D